MVQFLKKILVACSKRGVVVQEYTALRFCCKQNSCQEKKKITSRFISKLFALQFSIGHENIWLSFAKFHKKGLENISLVQPTVIMKYNRDRVIRLLDFKAPVETHKCNPAVSVQSIFYSFPSSNSPPSTSYLMHIRKIDLA